MVNLGKVFINRDMAKVNLILHKLYIIMSVFISLFNLTNKRLKASDHCFMKLLNGQTLETIWFMGDYYML